MQFERDRKDPKQRALATQPPMNIKNNLKSLVFPIMKQSNGGTKACPSIFESSYPGLKLALCSYRNAHSLTALPRPMKSKYSIVNFLLPSRNPRIIVKQAQLPTLKLAMRKYDQPGALFRKSESSEPTANLNHPATGVAKHQSSYL